MPTRHTLLVQCAGSPAYARYLDRLAAEARRRGHPIRTRAALAELALAALGASWGLTAPRRIAPVGSNQHGDREAAP